MIVGPGASARGLDDIRDRDDVMKLVQRVRALLLTPRSEWKVIEQEPKTPSDLFIDYVAILAAIPEVARFIGQSFVGDYAPIVPSLVRMVVVYLLTFVMVYIIACVINVLAPRIRRPEELWQRAQAVGLLAYAAVACGHFPADPGSELPAHPGCLRSLPVLDRIAAPDAGAG